MALVDDDNETWCAELDQDNTDWEEVTIDGFPWKDPWSADEGKGNYILDLFNIREIRFRHWPGVEYSGTFWVDELKIER